jgi:transcriptional regulator with XRE-family HTH domain
MDATVIKSEEIIKQIKTLALQQGITHSQIADKMNIKEQSVQRMLSGKYSPNLKHVIGLAESVGKKIQLC